MGVKPWEPGGQQRRRGIDWIMDRAVETERRADQRARADDAWRQIREGLAERSGCVRRQLAAAGTELAAIASVADFARLPLCSKADLRDTQERFPRSATIWASTQATSSSSTRRAAPLAGRLASP